MSILISGGCKNGKSMKAQIIARDLAKKKNVPLYYLATMKAKDEEDCSRIERHIKEREGWGFVTLEETEKFVKLSQRIERDAVVLFDSITAALENVIFDKNYNIIEKNIEMLATEIEQFAKNIENTVFVTDDIFCDGIVYHENTEAYRKALALVNRVAAQNCSRVIEIIYGEELTYK